MPLKYITHERPAQLEEELRNLYRQVDKLTAGSGTAIILPGEDDGDDDDGEGGGWWNVATWHLLLEFNEEMPPANTVYEFAVPIPPIDVPYTHLELHLAVLGAGGTGVTLEYTVQGDNRYWLWSSTGGYGAWTQKTAAKHYVFTPPYLVGRYEIEPTFVLPPYMGDMAFMLIYPASVIDGPAWEPERLKVLVKVVRTGEELSDGFCYKAKLLGRYAMYPTDRPGAEICLWDI